MYKGPPTGVPTGFLAKGHKTTPAATYEEVKAALEKMFLVPFEKNCHINELLEAKDGRRSIPARDEDVHNKVKYKLGHAEDPKKKIFYEPITEFRCATMLRERLDLFLVSCMGKPPLVQPRPGHEHSLFFIVYACHQFDPGNVTSWNSGGISPPKDGCYVKSRIAEKFKCCVELENMGYLHEGDMYNKHLRLFHQSLNCIKYNVLKRCYPHHAAEHDVSLKSCKEDIEATTASLISICYIRYRRCNTDVMTMANHGKKTREAIEKGILSDVFSVPGSVPVELLLLPGKSNELDKFCGIADLLKNFYEDLRVDLSRKSAPKSLKSQDHKYALLFSNIINVGNFKSVDTPALSSRSISNSVAHVLARKLAAASITSQTSSAEISPLVMKQLKAGIAIDPPIFPPGSFNKAAGSQIISEKNTETDPNSNASLGRRDPKDHDKDNKKPKKSAPGE
jgi:hypothetical protein